MMRFNTKLLPILDEFSKDRKKALAVSGLRPWDKAVAPEGREALKPFTNGKELTEKTIEVFRRLRPVPGTMSRNHERDGTSGFGIP